MSDNLYDEHVLEHFESPYHKGRLPVASLTHEDFNPLCGDRVRLEVLLDEHDHVKEAWFDGQGCAISQAAASMLTEQIEGKSLEELRAFQAPEMLDLIGVRLTASRQKCGLLCFRVLKTMIYTLDSQRAEAADAAKTAAPLSCSATSPHCGCS